MLSVLYPALRPLLFRLEPERAHALALTALEAVHKLSRVFHDAPAAGEDSPARVSLLGLNFPNRVGLAAGFDKNGRHIDALGALGFGFLEIGTVTPRAQSGQRQPRLFRLPAARALINRMGFPNEGAAAIAPRLAQRTFRGICGVNIGKNASTPMSEAIGDYLHCFRALAQHVDYVAINVSSPNTQDLRQLQQIHRLRPLLEALLEARSRLQRSPAESAGAAHSSGRPLPLLVKVSPDLTGEDLAGIARLVRELGIDGVIATNTTLARPGLAGMGAAQEQGGLSGEPLRAIALHVVRVLRSELGRRIPIIAAGGIDSAAAALDAVKAGADLVQIYTGLIYRGPALVGEIRSALRSIPRAES